MEAEESVKYFRYSGREFLPLHQSISNDFWDMIWEGLGSASIRKSLARKYGVSLAIVDLVYRQDNLDEFIKLRVRLKSAGITHPRRDILARRFTRMYNEHKQGRS